MKPISVAFCLDNFATLHLKIFYINSHRIICLRISKLSNLTTFKLLLLLASSVETTFHRLSLQTSNSGVYLTCYVYNFSSRQLRVMQLTFLRCTEAISKIQMPIMSMGFTIPSLHVPSTIMFTDFVLKEIVQYLKSEVKKKLPI